VSGETSGVFNKRVAGDFSKALLARPGLARTHQRRADAFPPKVFIDPPTLDIGDRRGVAPFRIGARANLDEAADRPSPRSATKTAAVAGPRSKCAPISNS